MKPCAATAKPSGGTFRAIFRIFPRTAFLCCAVVCAVAFAPAGAKAGCPGETATLWIPASKNSQIFQLYTPPAPAWDELSLSTLLLKEAPGRGGNAAWGKLADSSGSGCFMAAVQFPSLIMLTENKSSTITQDDIAPFLVFASVPNALWVDAESPIETLDDLADYARSRNPASGERFLVAGIGSHTDQHLATLQFDRQAGIRSTYIPVVGTAEAVAAVRQKRAHACWGYAMPAAGMQGMKMLAVADKQRSAIAPAVPTFTEAGFPVENIAWFGLALPAAAPEQKREELAGMFERIFSNPSVQAGLRENGASVQVQTGRTLDVFLSTTRLRTLELLDEYNVVPASSRRPPPLNIID